MRREYKTLLNDFQSFMNDFDNNKAIIYSYNKMNDNSPIRTLIKHIITTRYNDDEKKSEYYSQLLFKANDKELFFLAMLLYYNITTEEEMSNKILPILNLYDTDFYSSYGRIFIDTYLLYNYDIDPHRDIYDNTDINFILTFEGISLLPPILKLGRFLNDDMYCIYVYRTGKIDGKNHSPRETSFFFGLTKEKASYLYGKAYSILHHIKYPRKHSIDVLLGNN